MRIVTDTPEVLEARSDPSPQRVLCGVMAVLGIVVLVMQWMPDAEPAVLAYVLGALMTFSGFAGVALLRMETLRIDRGTGELVAGSRALLASRARRVDLSAIRQVVLDEDIDSDGNSAFRVELLLADGHRVPLTAMHSPDHSRTAALAERIRSRVAPDSRSIATPRGRVISAGSRRAEAWLIAAMLLFAIGFLAAGVHLAAREHRLLSQYRPVSAVVLDVTVDSRAGAEGDVVRRPSVRYAYTVSGTEHVSSRVTPLDEWRDGGWAREIAGRFAPGQRIIAYYDPLSPSDAYLLRRRSAMPLLFISLPLFGVLLLSYGSSGHLGAGRAP